MKTVSTVKVVRAGEGEKAWAMGEKFTFKLGPEDTCGSFIAAETLAQPQNGPPPHIHHREDELFHILEGEFTFAFRDRTFTRKQGFSAYLPRKMLHTYKNAGSSPGKLLVISTPSGFEEFIRRWSRPVQSATEPPPSPTQEDIDRLLAAAREFEIELRPEAKLRHDHTQPPPCPSRWVLGQFVTVQLASQDTCGNFSVAEVVSPPGSSVPKHLHLVMDELFYVLDGTVEFNFADHVERIKKGGMVFVPRGEVHGFRNAGVTLSKMLDIHSPGGFEAFFEEAGVPATSSDRPPLPTQPDRDQLVALFRKHGMEVPGI
jgi:mannose-6-phosphate isomerase-like protein (cupin superfamily)